MKKETVNNFSKSMYPNLYNQLIEFKNALGNRRETLEGKNKWFHLWWSRSQSLFEKGSKLIWTSRSSGHCFTYTDDEFYG